MEKHYRTLGLDPRKQYTAQELKEAWRKKCLEVHPDRGGTEKAFNEVTHSFNMLSNPSYRNEDRDGSKVNLNIRLHIPISFEEGFFGTTLIINYNQGIINNLGDLQVEEMYKVGSHTLMIPPATCQPCEFVLKGKGLLQKDSIDKGDAYVSIVPGRHRKFAVHGLDVHSLEQVGLDKLLKGGSIEVETMYGIETLKIPPGTPPESKLRIKGKGAMGVGCHVVTVRPVFPSKAELKNCEEWKDLNINWEEEK